MDIMKYMKALPVVAALLLTASCDNEDNAVVEEPQQAQSIIIPYEATVRSGSETRASLNGNKYIFQKGDKLFVWGNKKDEYGNEGELIISGELTLDGDGGGTEGTFKGSLTYTPQEGHPTPADDLELNAVLKGADDKVIVGNTTVDFLAASPNVIYPTGTAAVATSDAEAVQMYSYFTASTLFGFKDFSGLYQNSTFISFDVTLEDGTAAGEPVAVTIKNGTDDLFSGTVTTVDESGAIKAKFTAGLAGFTWLKDATVTLDSRDPISVSDNYPLSPNNIYTVTKTYKRYTMTATSTVPDIPELSITGGEKTKIIKIKEFPYVKTLAELLSEYDEKYAIIATYATCERASGTNVSVSESKPYTFTVSGLGTSVFNVSLLSYNIPVTITVTE